MTPASSRSLAQESPVGRFAPSPTGRMHLGNLFTAFISWLSVRSRKGRWILRIEDLDPQRSRREYAEMIESDLQWLGLDWDEGGVEGRGLRGPYMQSLRYPSYEKILDRLISTGKVYRCGCRRAELHAAGAPHASDGRVIYSGKCRPASLLTHGGKVSPEELDSPGALRLFVPPESISFEDRLYGRQSINLASEFGDFLLRRADGAWAYQLAVVADDAEMRVTEVVRAHDLLSSSAPQIYLYRLSGFPAPEFAHVPLICNSAGVRLSKRDASLGMEELRRIYTPEELTGRLAYIAGLIPDPRPCRPADLVDLFDFSRIPAVPQIIL